MIENEILKMLIKISSQLKDISSAQESIKRDIKNLSSELSSFEEYTLKNLEEKISEVWTGKLVH